ncbi:phosphopyruvate hydratase [Helicobacter pylori]
MKQVIENIQAMEIFDSRGNPTLEVTVALNDGTIGVAAVPSGASTGEKEAIELRDGEARLQGKGVKKAMKHVNCEINELLKQKSPFNQEYIDQLLIQSDNTKNKSNYGANAILGTSMAVSRVAANALNVPLYRYLGGIDFSFPQLFFNVINGGRHADSSVDIQEFLITPISNSTLREGIEMIANTYHTLKNILTEHHLNNSVGDEGGFAPNLNSSEEALQLLVEAIERADYSPGKDIALAIDPAASEFYNNGTYYFESEKYTTQQMIQYYQYLINNYPLISIEDGLSENDWEGFAKLTNKLGDSIELIGDDIFVTNPEIFKQGIKQNIGNAILIKLNQIGTVSETIKTIQLARKNNYKIMISHRSGETVDSYISDFAVAMNADQMKSGSIARSERVEKYNQLLRIEASLYKN